MKVLVLGGGSIGRRHLENLAVLGVSKRAVVEIDDEQRGSLVGMAEAFSTLEEGLAWQPSAVVVATPTALHLDQARHCANRGCHLFIEKPLSFSLEGLDELTREVERRGLVTLVGCNMRFHPGPAALKRLLEEGVVGDVVAARLNAGSYLPLWRPLQDYRQSYSASGRSGGAILDFIHELDAALWLFGPATVIAAAHRPATAINLDTDGLAEILLQHGSGVLGSVHMNFVQRDYRRNYRVIGSEGSLEWDFGRHAVHHLGPDGTLRVIDQDRNWKVNDMYIAEMKHFIDSVTQARPTSCPLADGAAALRLALDARENNAWNQG